MYKAKSVNIPGDNMVPQRLTWKDEIIPICLGGHPTLYIRMNRPCLLTRSKAFVELMKTLYNHMVVSVPDTSLAATFVKKVMSIVDLFCRKPHCSSGQTRSANFCNLFNTTRAKTLFLTILRRDITR